MLWLLIVSLCQAGTPAEIFAQNVAAGDCAAMLNKLWRFTSPAAGRIERASMSVGMRCGGMSIEAEEPRAVRRCGRLRGIPMSQPSVGQYCLAVLQP